MATEALAIAALGLSVCSFAYTWLKDRSQNRRWDAVNLARFAVRDLGFLVWRELSRSEYEVTKFGYASPYVIAASTSGVLGGNVSVPACVAAYRKNSSFETAITAVTVADVRASIIRRDEDPDDFDFVKYYRIQFALENLGSTPARKVSVAAKATTGEQLLGEFKGRQAEAEYAPGERAWFVVPFATSLGSVFPERLMLQVKIHFEDTHGREHDAHYNFGFDAAAGAFRRA